MTVLTGGRPFYGLPIGILLLDTRFPRPLGDIAHAETFDFPVLYRVVRQATPTRVVDDGAEGLVEAFCEAARELETVGVRAISTSCGFLALHQRTLAAAVGVPVLTSSLLQIPTLLAVLPPNRKVGVLTIKARALTPAHFAAAGVLELERVAVAGLEHADAIYQPLLENLEQLDTGSAEMQIVATARDFAGANPDLGAIVLECTNLPPYAAAIQCATGLPVWDAVTMVRWLHAAVRQRPFT